MLCSAANVAEALAALSAPTSAAPPGSPTNGHVKLPQGDVAVIVGCNTDIWEVQFVDRLLHGKSLHLSVLSQLFVFLDRQRFQQPI